MRHANTKANVTSPHANCGKQVHFARWPNAWIVVVSVVTLAVGLLFGGMIETARSGIKPQKPFAEIASIAHSYPSVDQLMAMTDEELGRVDPAVVNLVVAKGIPELDQLNVAQTVAALDAWAAEIRTDIERNRYQFVTNPAEFGHSEAQYRVDWLVSDIYTVFKVDYDVLDVDFRNPSNLFLNGIVDRKLGTCVSLPLLYAALGWRLGMPIKLVRALLFFL